MSIKYPYSQPSITEQDIAAVSDVLRSAYLTQGAQVDAFEHAFADLTGAPHAVSCCNGTAALHLAYLAAGLGPHSGLVTTPITFLSTASAARMTNAPIVFADVDPRTGNIDPEDVRRILKNQPFPIAAITAVHMGGRPCDMPALKAIADEYGCKLIEDASHAVGASYLKDDGNRVPVGACADSDLATFSFHAIKHIAMGEGGCVTTANSADAQMMRHLRSHSMSRNPDSWASAPELNAPWYYEMDQLGWNYRLTDIQCALGNSQLSRVLSDLERRQAVVSNYAKHLTDAPYVVLPAAMQNNGQHAWHLYTVFIDFKATGKSRGQVMRELAERGIGTQVHYIPLYHQPYFKEWAPSQLVGAEQYYERALSLPLYPDLMEADCAFIATSLKTILS